MASLVSLRGYEPKLQAYLLQQNYPALLEALLTGLAVMVPGDPWQFMLDKIAELREKGGVQVIQWDMFVDESMRPLLKRGMLDSLMEDGDDLPTQEVLEKVFEFRKKHLQRLCFDGWRIFYQHEKKENEAYIGRLHQARVHHTLKVGGTIFRSWRSYTVHKVERRKVACVKLGRTGDEFMLKLLFYAWLEDYKESRKARRWFNREVGSEDNGVEGQADWYWPEGEDPMSILPTDVAIKVFMLLGIQALGRCGRVCRSWKEIAADVRLWNQADFHSIGHFVRDDGVVRVCHKYRPLLCHLNLRGCVHLSSDSLKTIGYCQNLQDLNLSEIKGINEEVIQSIGRGCTGLLYLNLSYCYITDSIIRLLTKHYSSLHYLSLAYCTNFTSKGLFSISTGKGCRRLVHFDLSGCTQLLADGLGYIGRGCPLLNTLLLDDIPECNDAMLLKLVAHCRTLRHISLMGGSKISDKGFKYLAMENKRLRVIKIENNHVLTDITLRAFGKACRELTNLYVAGCSRISDQGMRALANLKKLQVLNVADCIRVTDTGVRHVIENYPGPQLRELNLTNLVKISDVTLLRISQHCRSLTCLSFCYCEHISDHGVEVLGHIPSLASLDLSGCSIQDDGIRGLRSNPQFRFLMLAELMDITDDGLQKMSSNLSNLDTLDISDCEQVSDEGIEQVTFNCRMLRTLYVANCQKVTDTGTKCIAKGCSYITQLDMSGCSITDRSLSLLRKFSSNLQRLDILCCMDITREAVLKLTVKQVEVNYNTDQPKFLYDQSESALDPIHAWLQAS